MSLITHFSLNRSNFLIVVFGLFCLFHQYSSTAIQADHLRFFPNITKSSCYEKCTLDRYCAAWGYNDTLPGDSILIQKQQDFQNSLPKDLRGSDLTKLQNTSVCYLFSNVLYEMIGSNSFADLSVYNRLDVLPPVKNTRYLMSKTIISDYSSVTSFPLSLIRGCSYTISLWYWLWRPKQPSHDSFAILSTRTLDTSLAQGYEAILPSFVWNVGKIENKLKYFASTTRDQHGDYYGTWFDDTSVRFHEWNHLTVTIDDFVMIIYQNGEQIGSIRLEQSQSMWKQCPHHLRSPVANITHQNVENVLLQIFGDAHKQVSAGMIHDLFIIDNHIAGEKEIRETLMTGNPPPRHSWASNKASILGRLLDEFDIVTLEGLDLLPYERNYYLQHSWGICPTVVCGPICLPESFFLSGTANSSMIPSQSKIIHRYSKEEGKLRNEIDLKRDLLKVYEDMIAQTVESMDLLTATGIDASSGGSANDDYSLDSLLQGVDMKTLEMELQALGFSVEEGEMEELIEGLKSQPSLDMASYSNTLLDDLKQTRAEISGQLKELEERLQAMADRKGQMDATAAASAASTATAASEREGIFHVTSASDRKPHKSILCEPLAKEWYKFKYELNSTEVDSLREYLQEEAGESSLLGGEGDMTATVSDLTEKMRLTQLEFLDLLAKNDSLYSHGSEGESPLARERVIAYLYRTVQCWQSLRYNNSHIYHDSHSPAAIVASLSPPASQPAVTAGAVAALLPPVSSTLRFSYQDVSSKELQDNIWLVMAMNIWLEHDLFNRSRDHDTDWPFLHPRLSAHNVFHSLAYFYSYGREEIEVKHSLTFRLKELAPSLFPNVSSNALPLPAEAELSTAISSPTATVAPVTATTAPEAVFNDFLVDYRVEALLEAVREELLSDGMEAFSVDRQINLLFDELTRRPPEIHGTIRSVLQSNIMRVERKPLTGSPFPVAERARERESYEQCSLAVSKYFSLSQHVIAHYREVEASLFSINGFTWHLPWGSGNGGGGNTEEQLLMNELLLARAQAGDANAQIDLARRLAWNQGNDPANEYLGNGWRWFEAAARQGHVEGLYNIGLSYLYGQHGKQKNLTKAYDLFYQSAYGRGSIREGLLGVNLDQIGDVPPVVTMNHSDSYRIPGFPLAIHALGNFHNDFMSYGESYYNATLAAYFYKHAAWRDIPEGHFSYGAMLVNSPVRKERNITEGIREISLAINQGHVWSMSFLGQGLFDPRSWFNHYIREERLAHPLDSTKGSDNSSQQQSPPIRFRLKGRTYHLPHPLHSLNETLQCELAQALFKHIAEHSVYGNKQFAAGVKEEKAGNLMSALVIFDEISDQGYEKAQEKSLAIYTQIQERYCPILTPPSSSLSSSSTGEGPTAVAVDDSIPWYQSSAWWRWKLKKMFESTFSAGSASVNSISLLSLGSRIAIDDIRATDMWIHEKSQLPLWLQQLNTTERCLGYTQSMRLKRLIQLYKQDNLIGKRKIAQMLLAMNTTTAATVTTGGMLQLWEKEEEGSLPIYSANREELNDIIAEGQWLLALAADQGDVESLIELGWLQNDRNLSKSLFEIALKLETNSSIRHFRSSTSGGIASTLALVYLYCEPYIIEYTPIVMEYRLIASEWFNGHWESLITAVSSHSEVYQPYLTRAMAKVEELDNIEEDTKQLILWTMVAIFVGFIYNRRRRNRPQ